MFVIYAAGYRNICLEQEETHRTEPSSSLFLDIMYIFCMIYFTTNIIYTLTKSSHPRETLQQRNNTLNVTYKFILPTTTTTHN